MNNSGSDNQSSAKRKYRVFINGQNFWLNIEGKPERMGFYTTRFIEAQNGKEAESIAVELIKADPKLLETVINDQSDPPMVYVEEVEETDELNPPMGYAFYPEERDVH